MIRSFAALATALLLAPTAHAFDTSAEAAFVIDQTTGTVLLDKNADVAQPPASMSKLMKLYMAFEAVRDGRLTLDEELPVSAHAQSYGGSSMFLRQGERVSVEDLIRGIIVLSGNDACVVIAEAVSPTGNEAGVARRMTQRAQQLGMTNSTFSNANGWPQAGHRMSMRDLALLSNLLITDFPQFYPLFAETEFEFDGRVPANRFNRNPLLTLGIGADGLKTGHTQEAGYGLTGSAVQGARRVIFVISGLETAAQRAQEAEAIVNWAFRQFAERTLAPSGTVLAEADVWMGAEPKVGLIPAEDITALVPVLASDMQAEVVFRGPIQAPIIRGAELAELVITSPEIGVQRFPLVADSDVAHGGFMARVTTAAKRLFEQLGEGTAPAS